MTVQHIPRAPRALVCEPAPIFLTIIIDYEFCRDMQISFNQ